MHAHHLFQIVVAHRDRLCRFAFDLIEYIFRLNGTTIVVVHSCNDPSTAASAANELAQDILAINTVFICRMQGQRSAENGQTNSQQGMQKKRKIGALLSYTRKKRKVEGLIRSLKVRIYPNMKQKNLMKRWMGCAR